MTGGRAAWVVGLALAAAPAAAHDPFEITADARLSADRLEVQITMARGTAARCCPGADLAGRGLDAAGLEARRPALEACARRWYAIRAAGKTLEPSQVRVALTREDDIEAALAYPAPAGGPLQFEAALLGSLADPTYGALLTVTSPQAFLGQQLQRAGEPPFEVELPQAGMAGAPPPPSPSFGEYLRLGVWHIFTGYDHLLFLLGLLAVCRRLIPALKIVTCFTLAHSITLAVAGLGVWALPGRVVEPLIAASIVFVGVENLLRGEEPKGRGLLAFAFGLVHGFGFAGALRQHGMGVSGMPFLLPLFSFNLGVELGQAAVAVAAFPLLWWLRRRPWLRGRLAPALSVVVLAGGLYWLLERTLGF
jgi:hydrogenase/urease accessory protein HupE